jgi:DNA repair protein RadC
MTERWQASWVAADSSICTHNHPSSDDSPTCGLGKEVTMQNIHTELATFRWYQN